ncbi:MAG: hypothetical protein ACLVAW_02250 [Eisenbergiella massiliensis]
MNYKFLSKTLLFRGNTEEEIKAMLSCLGAEQKHYIKGSTVYHAGEPVDAIGLVLSGRVQIENDDHWGIKACWTAWGGHDFCGNLCLHPRRAHAGKRNCLGKLRNPVPERRQSAANLPRRL